MGSDFKEIIDKSNWIKKKVVEVADVNQYSLSGKEKIGKIKYIEISEVNKGKVNKLSKIDFSSAPSRARRVVRNNDILISTVRPNLEHYAFLKNVEKKTIASTGFAVITAKDIEPRFLYYVLSSPRYTEYFSTIAAGHTSAYPAMNPDVIEQVEIPFPPLEEQKRIAHILGTLDDKIELNQRMNETLEAMARALFKAWFVDFEPVKAKIKGEPYPLPDEIMHLFPDELVESELGSIPKGWLVVSLNEIATFTKGVSYKGSDLIEAENALVNLKSISRGGGFKKEGLKSYAGPYKQPQIINNGDIVVAHTDLTQAAEVIGRAARIRDVREYKTLIASLDLMIVRGKEKHISSSYLYNLLSREEFVSHAFGYTNGTTVLHLNSKALPEYSFVLAPDCLIRKFSTRITHFYSSIDLFSAEIDTLLDIKGKLLPFLINSNCHD